MYTPDNTTSKAKPSCICVIGVYDRPESARRLKATLDQVSGQVELNIKFDLRLWRSDILEIPEFRDELMAGLEVCDLMVVAFSGHGIGPVTLRLAYLIEQWSSTRVVKVGSESGGGGCSEAGGHAAVLSLQELALEHGFDFLSAPEVMADSGKSA